LSPLVTKRRRIVAHDFGACLELLSVSLFSLLLLFFPFRFLDEKKYEENLSFSSLGIWFCRQGGLADGGFLSRT
jgi:mediator of RNA polymerase II transcription subunit 21